MKFPMALTVAAIESIRHLKVTLLLASLINLISLRALSTEMTPAYPFEMIITSMMDATTIIKSKILNSSYFHSLNLSPTNLIAHSKVKRMLKKIFV